jgi:hypothetical protein
MGVFGILATGISVIGTQQAFADSTQIHNNIHCSGANGGGANGGANGGGAGGVGGNGGIVNC